MQKQTITTKNKYARAHHVRISAVAIAMATGFHISGIGHMEKRGLERTLPATNLAQAFSNHMERENETARHAVRFDEGLRLPFTTGQ